MGNYYRCQFFEPEELVNISTIQMLELKGLDKEFVYKMMDSRLLMLIDYLRTVYGSLTINNWNIGGDRSESGLRIEGMKHYSPTSQHSFGRAVDAISRIDTATIIDEFIHCAHDEFLIMHNIQVTIEKDVDWLHIDVRNATNLVNFI